MTLVLLCILSGVLALFELYNFYLDSSSLFIFIISSFCVFTCSFNLLIYSFKPILYPYKVDYFFFSISTSFIRASLLSFYLKRFKTISISWLILVQSSPSCFSCKFVGFLFQFASLRRNKIFFSWLLMDCLVFSSFCRSWRIFRK